MLKRFMIKPHCKTPPRIFHAFNKNHAMKRAARLVRNMRIVAYTVRRA